MHTLGHVNWELEVSSWSFAGLTEIASFPSTNRQRKFLSYSKPTRHASQQLCNLDTLIRILQNLDLAILPIKIAIYLTTAFFNSSECDPFSLGSARFILGAETFRSSPLIRQLLENLVKACPAPFTFPPCFERFLKHETRHFSDFVDLFFCYFQV